MEYPCRQIPELPEELVRSILLLLPLKELTRTSILCKEYKFLWKSSNEVRTSLLNLDYKFVVENSVDYINLTEMEKKEKFLKWLQMILLEDDNINKIMSCKIAFPLDEGQYEHSHSNTIYKCISYLSSKRVEELTIDLTEGGLLSASDLTDECLLPASHFSVTFWQFPSSLKHLSTDGCYLVKALQKTDETTLPNLISLTLGHRVLRNDQMLDILSACLSLERFSIRRCCISCRTMVTASQPQNLKLKHFEIISCYPYPPKKKMTIEIHNAKELESVTYVGGIYRTVLKNSAQPNKLRFGLDNLSPKLAEQCLNYAFGKLPLALPQIETMSLSLSNIKENMLPKRLSTFSKLTTLDLDMNIKGASPKGMFEVTSSILKASPLLHRFFVHLPVDFLAKKNNDGLVEGDEAVNLEKYYEYSFQHERLSDVEIKKFIGVQIQVDYIILFLGHVINLEKIKIIRQGRFHERDGKREEDELPVDIDVKQVNDLFVGKVPKSTQFQVL